MTDSQSIQENLRNKSISVFLNDTVCSTEKDKNMHLSSVGIAMGCSAEGIGVRFPAGAKYFSVLRNVQTGSGAHPDFYPMDTGGCFPGRVKRQGREANTHLHLVPRSRKVELYLHYMA
jgi:hypothetical protein